MSKFSLDAEMDFEIIVHFIAKGDDKPVTGFEYKARLFDREIFQDDDFIGESGLDEYGIARFRMTADVYENVPDLGFGPEFYITIIKNDKEIYKSKVVKNIDLKIVERYKKGVGEVIDFGTFLIDA